MEQFASWTYTKTHTKKKQNPTKKIRVDKRLSRNVLNANIARVYAFFCTMSLFFHIHFFGKSTTHTENPFDVGIFSPFLANELIINERNFHANGALMCIFSGDYVEKTCGEVYFCISRSLVFPALKQKIRFKSVSTFISFRLDAVVSLAFFLDLFEKKRRRKQKTEYVFVRCKTRYSTLVSLANSNVQLAIMPFFSIVMLVCSFRSHWIYMDLLCVVYNGKLLPTKCSWVTAEMCFIFQFQ